jgi:hypothetical protein
MTDLLSLPTELQRQCFNYLDSVDLKAVRLSSSHFRDVANQVLFRLVALRVEEESVGRITSLINDASLRRCIRTV